MLESFLEDTVADKLNGLRRGSRGLYSKDTVRWLLNGVEIWTKWDREGEED